MLISIEGIDGAGKGTQAEMLARRIRSQELQVATYSFPQYGQNPFSEQIAEYLNSASGDQWTNVKLISLLYACDRSTVAHKIAEQQEQGTIVICDRYAESNMAHQAARFQNEREALELIQWLARVEYDTFRLPVPDLILLLDVPVSLASERIARKKRRKYTELAADRHESDVRYLERTAAAYRHLAIESPAKWRNIPAVSLEGEPLDERHIAELCWTAVSRMLQDL